ncbi:MAG: NAD-dependent epimerase/dehydratase family protein, partial [Saprospiraceae bacterium]|nr:NAD-dependent epimerase/dehydratase family protein [Saprospiraceae bacterium]
MKIVIIGGTGHIGSFLVPRLVLDGHEVISLSRLDRKPYFHHVAWESVRQISINREIDERENKFADKILR